MGSDLFFTKTWVAEKINLTPFLLCAFSFTLLCGCQRQELYKDKRVMMGTFVEVTSADKRAAGIVFEEIARVEDLLSKYKENSDVYKLNKEGRGVVSPDTFYVLEKAKEFWLASNGAFDITVEPLVGLWGFKDKKYILPEQEKINAALKLVGTDKIIFHQSANVIEFKVPGMKIDLGAIAKGYAVDCAIARLKSKGIKSCVVNAGGEIYSLGDKFGRPWIVAVKNPRGEGSLEPLSLRDKAAATSGDYQQYFIKGNIRYSHIFNPKTGYPADAGVVSVTIFAPDCLTADALATSIFVLGKAGAGGLMKKFPDTKAKITEIKDIGRVYGRK